jgi:hypothetical protein
VDDEFDLDKNLVDLLALTKPCELNAFIQAARSKLFQDYLADVWPEKRLQKLEEKRRDVLGLTRQIRFETDEVCFNLNPSF